MDPETDTAKPAPKKKTLLERIEDLGTSYPPPEVLHEILKDIVKALGKTK